MALFHSFLWLNNIPLHACVGGGIHSASSLSIGLLMENVGCSHVLVFINSAAVNTGVHISF